MANREIQNDSGARGGGEVVVIRELGGSKCEMTGNNLLGSVSN